MPPSAPIRGQATLAVTLGMGMPVRKKPADEREVVLPGLCAARRAGAPINTAPGRACKDLLQVRLGRFLCRPASSPLALDRAGTFSWSPRKAVRSRHLAPCPACGAFFFPRYRHALDRRDRRQAAGCVA